MIDFAKYPPIETDWLADHLTECNLRIVDMRWRGDDTGQEVYQSGHIPGAIHVGRATTRSHYLGTHLSFWPEAQC